MKWLSPDATRSSGRASEGGSPPNSDPIAHCWRAFAGWLRWSGLLRRSGLLVIALAATGSSAAPMPPATAEAVTRAIEVWSLARYRHPEVVACARDWDAVLVEALPALESSTAPLPLEQALMSMLDRAGSSGAVAIDAGTPEWIRASDYSTTLKNRLAWLAAQRPQRQCYVAPGPANQGSFPRQSSLPFEPDRAHRILAAAQYWAAIEYFFPYLNDIGRPWREVLREHLPEIADSATLVDYRLQMRRFTAGIQDAHGFFQAPGFLFGDNPTPPFRARQADGRVYVEDALPEAAPVTAGDEVLSVDGEDLATRRQRFQPYSYGSNPISHERNLLTSMLGGYSHTLTYRLRRRNGTEYSVALSPDEANRADLRDRHRRASPWWIEPLAGGCRAGVVNLYRMRIADVDRMLAALAETDLMVLDLRTYPPENVMWSLVERLYPQPRTMAQLDFPDFTRPGHYRRQPNILGGRQPSPYRGRLLVLVDEESQSASEFSAMGFQAIERTLVIGSQTAGADGNITRVDLAGGISTWFSGLGVYYPDGRPTQRVGIVPDVHVFPNAQDLLSGRDAVLETALDCRWVSTDPAPRNPPSGLYWQPERSGEGYDLVRFGQRMAVFRFGYDEAGKSEWMLGSAELDGGLWEAEALRFRWGEAPEPATRPLQLDFQRGPYHPACAVVDQARLHPRATLRWAGAEQAWPECLEPFLINAGQGLSGSWAGPDAELGWGLNLHEQAGRLVVVLFVYDSDGRPRWLLGSADLVDGDIQRIPMLRYTGFCRECAPQPVQTAFAGDIVLQRLEPRDDPDSGLLFSSQIEVDVGSRWERERMPLRRLSRE